LFNLGGKNILFETFQCFYSKHFLFKKKSELFAHVAGLGDNLVEQRAVRVPHPHQLRRPSAALRDN
jgi:hypothetical protein